MELKKLPSEKFGELMQCLYDCEINLSIAWMWDSGFDWAFGDNYNGFSAPHPSTTQLAGDTDDTDIEVVGGLIIHEYLKRFDGRDSEGNTNKMYDFLIKNGFKVI